MCQSMVLTLSFSGQSDIMNLRHNEEVEKVQFSNSLFEKERTVKAKISYYTKLAIEVVSVMMFTLSLGMSFILPLRAVYFLFTGSGMEMLSNMFMGMVFYFIVRDSYKNSIL